MVHQREKGLLLQWEGNFDSQPWFPVGVKLWFFSWNEALVPLWE